MARRIPGRRQLREWRESQQPKVPLDAVGDWIAKTGRMVGLWETGKTELSVQDRILISERTGIPLDRMLSKGEIELQARVSKMLSADDGPLVACTESVA